MNIKCEICGKEFKTTQGRRGHMTFVHKLRNSQEPPTGPDTKQGLSKPEDITGVRETDVLERLLGITDTPLTEQVSDLTKQVSQLTEQLKRLDEQLELGHVTEAKLDTHEAGQKMQMEQLHNECQDAHNELVSIIYRIDEFVKNRLSTTEDANENMKRQVSELKNAVRQLDEGVRAKLALDNQLRIRFDSVEGKISRLETEISVVKNLARRVPTGKIVGIQLSDKREHHFREYKSPQGLARSYRTTRDLILGDRWVDLAEPED